VFWTFSNFSAEKLQCFWKATEVFFLLDIARFGLKIFNIFLKHRNIVISRRGLVASSPLGSLWVVRSNPPWVGRVVVF
jgi:hypothetical protein